MTEKEKKIIEIETDGDLSFINSEGVEAGRLTSKGEMSAFVAGTKDVKRHLICSELKEKKSQQKLVAKAIC